MGRFLSMRNASKENIVRIKHLMKDRKGLLSYMAATISGHISLLGLTLGQHL